MTHKQVKGNHSECGPDCVVTGDLCCGGKGACRQCSRPKEIGFSLDAPALIKEIARNLTSQGWGVVGVIMGLQLLLELLVQIANRAHEINDMPLIATLNRMGITKTYIGKA